MKEDLKKQFASNVKAERVRAGLTQRETAERLGITVRQYINYEQGRRIDQLTLFRLSRIFNCSIDAFFLKFTSTEGGYKGA